MMDDKENIMIGLGIGLEIDGREVVLGQFALILAGTGLMEIALN